MCIRDREELSGFSHVFDQFGYRKGLILKTLEEEGVDIHELSGVAGRGGLMNPIPGGTYRVNERMLEDLEHAVHGEHPSNLGAALARSCLLYTSNGFPNIMCYYSFVTEM